MNNTKKKKVGGTPTLNNLSADDLRVRILRELENARSQISGMRLLAQQRKWWDLAQANKDLAELVATANVTLREADRRKDKMRPWKWPR